MKKLLAVILSVAMSFGILSPAAAAEPVISELPQTTRTIEAFNKSFFSLTGFADVSDRTAYLNTEYYRKVSDETSFLKAIEDAANDAVKVIEITKDLDLGWNSLEDEARNLSCISKYDQDPHNGYTNPTLMETGVSQLTISNTNGLTIFSTNGVTISHAEWKLQGTSSDLVIRNLSFDEMWQWDEAADRLNISKETGWTFIKINGAKNVWIDHCSFSLAGDGNVDSENGAEGITLSWCAFGLPTDFTPDKNSMIYKTISYMEQRYQNGTLSASGRYKLLRDAGASPEEIMAYTAEHFKLNLNGAGDKDFMDGVSNGVTQPDGNQRLRITHAYNQYTNIGCRIPFIRQGIGHLFNCYIDDWDHMELHYSKDYFQKYGMYDLSQCLYARNGATVGADTCIFYGADEPLAGSEYQSDDWTTSYETMTDEWKHRLSNTRNRSLIVNSRVSKVGTDEVYEGSSWDNDGENLFTNGAPLNPSHRYIWRDKSTIGVENWTWTSVIEGVENMTKNTPSNEPFNFLPTYEDLPYAYKIVALDDVESVVKGYGGAGVLDMSEEEWLSTDYKENEAVKLTSEEAIPATGLTFRNEEQKIGIGEMKQLLVDFEPFDTTETELIWESSDAQIAEVLDSGLIIGKKQGTARITATIKGTEISAEYIVTVYQPVTSIQLSASRLSLYENETAVLQTEVLPADATDKTLVWSSSNNNIATVDENGTVSAVAAGNALINCSAADGSGTRVSCRITVIEGTNPKPSESVSPTPGAPDILLGDVDKSNVVDAADALLVLKHAAKLLEITDPDALYAADIDKDTKITAEDALLILKKAAKLIEL